MNGHVRGQSPAEAAAASVPVMGPATHAARRSRFLRRSQRPYPLPLYEDSTGDAVVLAATRALVTATTREQVVDVLHAAVNDLGGGVVAARLVQTSEDVIDIDVSLGVGEPRVVRAGAVSPERMRLTQHLPVLVQDALMAAAACDAVRRQVEGAAVDALTKVSTRGAAAPRIAAAAPGDVLCMLDLDRFKDVNDERGHAAGDTVLEALGGLLREAVRETDVCARYGGDEFVVLLAGAPLVMARQRMEVLVARWAELPGHGTGLSVGIAVVGAAGATAALEAADAALYQAKRSGRGRVVVASHDDQEQSHEQ